MKTLFLNLASNEGSIACVTEQSTVSLQTLDHRISDAELPTVLESILKEAGWTLKDLTHLACALGPGGFTSLRVGVASINALAYGLGIPAVGVHLSDLYESRVTSSESREGEVPSRLTTQDSRPLWLHSTKKTHLFVRNFAKNEEPHLVSLEELPSLLAGAKEWMGELIPEHRAVVDAAGLKQAELRPLADVLPSFLAAQQYSAKNLEPWYGRGW